MAAAAAAASRHHDDKKGIDREGQGLLGVSHGVLRLILSSPVFIFLNLHYRFQEEKLSRQYICLQTEKKLTGCDSIPRTVDRYVEVTQRSFTIGGGWC